MKHISFITIGLILYGVVVWFSRGTHSEETVCAVPAQVNPIPTTAADYFPACGTTPEEKAAYAQALEERRHSLTVLEERRALQTRAAEKLVATRKVAQIAAKPSWEALLKKNAAKFEGLRREAARQPNGLTPCTICDGMSNLACIMCDHRDGRCVSCHGSGRHNTELCPSCGGSGKCYLCAGYGQMLCPFCNDGTIEANRPMPSDKPPIQ